MNHITLILGVDICTENFNVEQFTSSKQNSKAEKSDLEFIPRSGLTLLTRTKKYS